MRKKLANFVKVWTFSFIFVHNSRTTMCEFPHNNVWISAQLRVNFSQVRLWFRFNLCDLFKVCLILFNFVSFRLHFVLTFIFSQATLHLSAIAQKCVHLRIVSFVTTFIEQGGIILHYSRKFSFRELWELFHLVQLARSVTATQGHERPRRTKFRFWGVIFTP